MFQQSKAPLPASGHYTVASYLASPARILLDKLHVYCGFRTLKSKPMFPLEDSSYEEQLGAFLERVINYANDIDVIDLLEKEVNGVPVIQWLVYFDANVQSILSRSFLLQLLMSLKALDSPHLKERAAAVIMKSNSKNWNLFHCMIYAGATLEHLTAAADVCGKNTSIALQSAAKVSTGNNKSSCLAMAIHYNPEKLPWLLSYYPLSQLATEMADPNFHFFWFESKNLLLYHTYLNFFCNKIFDQEPMQRLVALLRKTINSNSEYSEWNVLKKHILSKAWSGLARDIYEELLPYLEVYLQNTRDLNEDIGTEVYELMLHFMNISHVGIVDAVKELDAERTRRRAGVLGNIKKFAASYLEDPKRIAEEEKLFDGIVEVVKRVRPIPAPTPLTYMIANDPTLNESIASLKTYLLDFRASLGEETRENKSVHQAVSLRLDHLTFLEQSPDDTILQNLFRVSSIVSFLRERLSESNNIPFLSAFLSTLTHPDLKDRAKLALLKDVANVYGQHMLHFIIRNGATLNEVGIVGHILGNELTPALASVCTGRAGGTALELAAQYSPSILIWVLKHYPVALASNNIDNESRVKRWLNNNPDQIAQSEINIRLNLAIDHLVNPDSAESRSIKRFLQLIVANNSFFLIEDFYEFLEKEEDYFIILLKFISIERWNLILKSERSLTVHILENKMQIYAEAEQEYSAKAQKILMTLQETKESTHEIQSSYSFVEEDYLSETDLQKILRQTNIPLPEQKEYEMFPQCH